QVNMGINPAWRERRVAQIEVYRRRIGIDGDNFSAGYDHARVVQNATSTVEHGRDRDDRATNLSCCAVLRAYDQRQRNTQENGAEPGNSCIFHAPLESKRR